jgi:hypothetical protein
VLAGLTGVVALVVLLQGVWAGIFLQGDDRDQYSHYIDVHAWGAHIATALAAVAAVWAIWRLRSHRDLWMGSVLLFVLLLVESYIGGRITDDGNDSLTVVHIPLAMLTLVAVAYLPVRALWLRRSQG